MNCPHGLDHRNCSLCAATRSERFRPPAREAMRTAPTYVYTVTTAAKGSYPKPLLVYEGTDRDLALTWAETVVSENQTVTVTVRRPVLSNERD